MPSLVESYKSTKIVQFLMTVIGMRCGETKREQLLIDCLLIYMIATVFIAVFVENSDLIYSRNDIYALTYNAPCSFNVSFDFIKLMIFTYKRRELFALNRFVIKTFWKKEYEQADKEILNKCDVTSTIGMSIMSLLASSVALHYLLGPQLDAIGTNSTERVLPFRVVYDLPLTVTPYYEIMLYIEVIGTASIALCSISFASYLYYTCIFISGQFKILQRELESICEMQLKSKTIKSTYNPNKDKSAYEKLKDCVRQHQLLIWYIGQLENLFSYILLMLVLCFVIILCFSGFQLVLGPEVVSFHRKILSVEYVFTGTVQLTLFASSCNEIFDASAAIGKAAYRCRWYDLPCDEHGRAVRQGLSIMVMRSYNPCTITVGKFCPMTLQVLSSVLSTSLSYFTVLRSMNESE